MRSKLLLPKVFVLPVLVAVLFVVAACQKEEQVEEAKSTIEVEVEPKLQPTSEPTATEAAIEEPTEEVTEEAMTADESTAAEAPALVAADMEEHLSVTEFFSIKVPAGWSSEETFPGGAFVMANTEAALARYRSGSIVEPGDFVLNVGFLPFVLFKQREVVPLGIQLEATPDVFLQSLLPMFNVKGEAVLSDVQLVSTNGERDAGMLTVSDEGREGMILMFVAGDGVAAFVSTVGYPGEMTKFQDIAYAVAAEVTFSGAQDALYGTFLGG